SPTSASTSTLGSTTSSSTTPARTRPASRNSSSGTSPRACARSDSRCRRRGLLREPPGAPLNLLLRLFSCPASLLRDEPERTESDRYRDQLGVIGPEQKQEREHDES